MEKEKETEMMDKVDKIYEALVGTLEQPGFIEKTNVRLGSLEKTKKVGMGLIMTSITLFIGKVIAALVI